MSLQSLAISPEIRYSNRHSPRQHFLQWKASPDMESDMAQTKKWARSRALLRRAASSLPHGVSSPFRAAAPVPLYFRSGEGSRLVDVDANEYIDFALAWGPLILGHRHPRIIEAMRAAADQPLVYGAQHQLEPEVCERIQRLVPCAERIALTSSGSEAVQLAFRLARAATGRSVILKFEGHYHGWMDSALVSYKATAEALGPRNAPRVVLGSMGQPSNSVDNAACTSWNDVDLLNDQFSRQGDRIAAVVMEPVLCNSGCLLPKAGYLEAVREICDRAGALLIFDEVITGFRIGLGGAQEAFGVIPDITTLGKALGGGVPVSAVAGRAGIMGMIAPGQVAWGGTFNGNPLSLAGTRACLDALAERNGDALRRANRAGARMMDGIRDSAARLGIRLSVTGFGAAFAIHFTSRGEIHDYRDTLDGNRDLLARFIRRALDEGLYLLPDGRFYVSAAHSQRDIDEAIAAVDRTLSYLVESA